MVLSEGKRGSQETFWKATVLVKGTGDGGLDHGGGKREFKKVTQ